MNCEIIINILCVTNKRIYYIKKEFEDKNANENLYILTIYVLKVNIMNKLLKVAL